jgi:hypothetical protein
MLFKNSVRTSKRTPHFTITKINWLTLFKEVIGVYIETQTRPVHNAQLLAFKAGGTDTSHLSLKG